MKFLIALLVTAVWSDELPFRGEPAMVEEPIWTEKQKPITTVEADCVSLTSKSYGFPSVGDAFSFYETISQSASRY